jgi:VanZ family protein
VSLTKNLLVPKQLLFAIALFWTGVIAYFCLEKASDLPVITIPYLDKFVHSFFHFGFTLVWFSFFRKQLPSSIVGKLLLYAFLLSFVFGVSIEFLQEFYTKTRKGDVFDVMANTSGSVFAVFTIVICNKLNFFNRILKN